MTIRLGANPIAWSNDDMPELGGATPLEQCLAEARQAGFAGIELGNKFPRDEATLRPILDRHGLALVSGWWSARLLERGVEAEMRAVEDHLALLAAMGCGVMVFAETSGAIAGRRDVALSRRPVLPEPEWQGFGQALSEVARRLAARGVRLAYHHHMGTVVETEGEIDRLLETTGPELGLLLDTGHLFLAGGDPARAARRHRARINHVHCKDVRPDVLRRARAEDWSFLDAVLAGIFTVPGDGAIDFAPVLRALAGYSGWLVVEAEQDPAKAHPLTYATLGCRTLRAVAREAGMEVAP
jgi:myo-inosose-2 dehydratase